MKFSIFSENGIIKANAEAKIDLANIEYAYGFGVYESLKVRHQKLYFVKTHVQRLFDSAAEIDLKHKLKFEQIKSWIEELVKKLETDACNIKMLLIGAKNPEDVKLYIIPLAPLFPNRNLYKKGAKTMVFEYERWKPNCKSLNMLPSYFYYSKAKENGCYDALLKDRNGNILEGTRTNFFAIKNKTLFCAPIGEILEGVTYKTVLKTALENGFEFKEKLIQENDLEEYDSLFLTSTSSKIIPISEIDGKQFGISDELKNLMKIYDQFLEKNSEI